MLNAEFLSQGMGCKSSALRHRLREGAAEWPATGLENRGGQCVPGVRFLHPPPNQRVRNSTGESTRLLPGRCRFDPCRTHQSSSQGKGGILPLPSNQQARSLTSRAAGFYPVGEGASPSGLIQFHGEWRNGSALGSDPRGCWFESSLPDFFQHLWCNGEHIRLSTGRSGFDSRQVCQFNEQGCRLTARHWSPKPGIVVQFRAPLPVFTLG